MVDAGIVTCMWLGQAGLAIESRVGTTALVDPYLSDHAESTHGLTRMSASPLPDDAPAPAILLVTHSHVDHLDPPTVARLAGDRSITLVAPPRVVAKVERDFAWQGQVLPLPAGERASVADYEITATWTRHGSCEEALGLDESVGFIIEVDGTRLWHLGDTEYDATLHRTLAGSADVAFLPVNGSGGNMNGREAALLALELRVMLAVPMHYGMWTDEAYRYDGAEPWATPDPAIFLDTCVQLGVPTPATPLRAGESLRFGAGCGQASRSQGAEWRPLALARR